MMLSANEESLSNIVGQAFLLACQAIGENELGKHKHRDSIKTGGMVFAQYDMITHHTKALCLLLRRDLAPGHDLGTQQQYQARS